MKQITRRFFCQLLLVVFMSINVNAQSTKITSKASPKAPEIGKCFIKTDSLTVQNVKVADLISWVEHPPFWVGCEDKKEYLLKRYEFTFLTLKPFINQSYGIGDDKMIPILARKAMDTLKPGDTVILKTVVLSDKEGKESTIPTLSLKITD